DSVAGTRGCHLGDAQVDAGGFRPEPRLAETGDLVRTSGNDTHTHGRSAIGRIDSVPADVRIAEQVVDRLREGAHTHQLLVWMRTASRGRLLTGRGEASVLTSMALPS